MNEQDVITWRMEFTHSNHTKINTIIKAYNEKNRDEQAKNILYARYRRKLGLDGVVFTESEE
jgi:hypothetical protein